MDRLQTYDQNNPFNQSHAIFDEMVISETQFSILIFGGILGFIGCVFYILGGVKLLNAKSQNYHFSKISLMSFLILNTLTMIL